MIKTTIVGYGQGEAKNMTTYVERLDMHLASYYPSILWSVHNVTTKSSSIKELIKDLEHKVLIHNPNLICIRMGHVNVDQSSQDFLDKKAFHDLLTSLLERIHTYNNRTGLNGCIPIPIIIGIPPIIEKKGEESCSNNRISQYNYIIKEVVRNFNGIFIDLFESIIHKVYSDTYIKKEDKGLSDLGEDLLYDLVFVKLVQLINYQGVLKERDVTEEEF